MDTDDKEEMLHYVKEQMALKNQWEQIPDWCPARYKIKSTIKSGSVSYFTEKSFYNPEPHYFIVIKQLACKPEMAIGIVEKLCEAVIASPIVENCIKDMVKAWWFAGGNDVLEEGVYNIFFTTPYLPLSPSRGG